MTWPIRRPSRQQKLAFQHAYRVWRAEQLSAISSKAAAADRSTSFCYEGEEDAEPLHPWRQARDGLEALRDKVVFELRWQPNPEHLPCLQNVG
jgi:hypothetical protein